MDKGTTSEADAALPAMLAQRAAQWAEFGRWEREQARRHAGRGGSPADVERALDWYAEALEFAERCGSAGPDAPERHLEDLVAWVQRWRRAWEGR